MKSMKKQNSNSLAFHRSSLKYKEPTTWLAQTSRVHLSPKDSKITSMTNLLKALANSY